jgi:two-component system KDP operon response regulator KdpE
MARILVADDEAPMRNLMALACQMDGHVVQTTSDTAGTIAAYATWRPDLLLLDLGMPGGGGLEVLRHAPFAANGATCPVIVVSGILEYLSEEEMQALGATTRIAKPFTIEQLRMAVRTVLAASPPSG